MLFLNKSIHLILMTLNSLTEVYSAFALPLIYAD